ncbi:hypothetical protein [Actinomyces howellii]|uniref:Zonula occludens toxin n=1 Tax=Actinomyces howellii TaxID=52771 RepID=A0A448HJY6_9ACTO|nr:hypothetical protein [Actinomyces howellii]VEG30003.1 Zonula occludens toxin [Actinomyces howellii]
MVVQGQENRDERPGAELLSSRSFVVGMVFVVVVALMAVWLVVDSAVDQGRDESVEAPASNSPADREVAASAAGEDPSASSVCGLSPGEQAPPSGPLPMEVVSVTDTVSVPVVEGVGPGRVTNGQVSHCFAHSPTGAVVAAANFLRWFSAQERLPDVVETLVAPGTDRDRLLEQIELGWDGGTTRPFAVMGYKVEVRRDDEVLVTMLTSTSVEDRRLVSWPLVMVWQDGDWKVQAPSTDSWGQEGQESDAGFTPWVVR